MTLSPAEETLLRTYPQETKRYLSIYQPQVALKCQINGAYDEADQTVDYDNVTDGSYTNIIAYNYQVALIGTAPGLDDMGRTWVRGATATSLRFLESGHINWQDNLYITVLKYNEIIPVFPRIIQNPSDPEDVIFYKLWDVAYTNQNSVLGCFVNMGSHYAGFVDEDVYWSSSGTTHLKGDSLTYSWIFEGGTPTGSTAHTPGYVHYANPGHYRTFLQINSSGGSVDKSTRYVSMYDRPGGANPPITDWSFSEQSVSVDGRGGGVRIKVRQPIPHETIVDNALVIIFGEDWYGDTKQSLSNGNKGREKIKFVGYIDGGTVQFNYRDGWVEFSVLSPARMMEVNEGFSISVESSTNPTVWYELLNMTVKRALYHYMYWQTTIMQCCDIHANFNDLNIQYFDADRSSLYDAINTLMWGALRGRTVSDRLGSLHFYQDVSAMSSGSVALENVMNISSQDWVGEPIITERQVGETSFIEMGGITYVPGTDSLPYLSAAPSHSPAYRGGVERIQGLALPPSGQNYLNDLNGNVFAFNNSRYPDVQIKLRSNASHIDVAPQQQVKLWINPEDTRQRVNWNGKSFVVRGVSTNWDARNSLETQTLTLAEIPGGFAAESIIIPVEPPDTSVGDGGGGGSYSQPPVNVPQIPSPTTAVPVTSIPIYYKDVFVMNASKLNFIGNVVWVEQNGDDATMADIYIEACGCSGTAIPNGGLGVYGEANIQSNTYPVSANISKTVSLYGAELAVATVVEDSDGFFDNLSSTATITIPYSGKWTIDLVNLALFYPNGISDSDDFTMNVSFKLDEATGSRTKNQDPGTTFDPIDDASPYTIIDGTDYVYRIENLFLASGQRLILTITVTVTVSSMAATNWFIGVDPQTKIRIYPS